MRNLIHISVIILVIFSLSTETYLFMHGSLDIPNLPAQISYRLVYYYSYFTILSNITIAIGALLLLINPNRDSTWFRVLRLDGLICIIITSAVYNLVLRNNHPPEGIMIITNEFLHVIVPLLAVLGWLLYGPRFRIDQRTMLIAVFPPLLYIIYIFIRGEITGLYPYPFLDAGKIGLLQALVNTGGVIVVFFLLEFILYFIDRKLSKK